MIKWKVYEQTTSSEPCPALDTCPKTSIVIISPIHTDTLWKIRQSRTMSRITRISAESGTIRTIRTSMATFHWVSMILIHCLKSQLFPILIGPDITNREINHSIGLNSTEKVSIRESMNGHGRIKLTNQETHSKIYLNRNIFNQNRRYSSIMTN